MEVEEGKPVVVVGLDFGTSFSGFAFCHQSDPKRIHTFYEWPNQSKGGSKPYCKTQTSLYYVIAKASHRRPLSSLCDEDYVLKNWGWSAQVEYLDALQAFSRNLGRDRNGQDLQMDVGFLVQRFKLRLASGLVVSQQGFYPPQHNRSSGGHKIEAPKRQTRLSSVMKLGKRVFTLSQDQRKEQQIEEWENIKAELEEERKQDVQMPGRGGAACLSGYDDLPPGMTVERVISDYLAKIADFIMDHLQLTYGKHLTKRDVQWCLTVPAIWDDRSKQQMRICAERAGMVKGSSCPADLAGFASPHLLTIVLESEAASVYCLTKSSQTGLGKGSQFLVADVGGGTVDIVVHVKDNDSDNALSIQEARQSTGSLCGGSHVDQNFFKYLSRKIGCFDEYLRDNPTIAPVILRRWDEVKCSFDGSPGWDQSVHFELPRRLEAAWKSYDTKRKSQGDPGYKPAMNYEEVNITLAEMKLIFDPIIDRILGLIRAEMTPDIKILMVVGGFSASPYLMRRLRGAFAMQVEELLCPPEPGSAICQGAVALGAASKSIMTHRIARRTYGIAAFRNTSSMDPPGSQVVRDGKWRCRDGFHIFVRKGERLGIDQCVQQYYSPAVADQKGIRFDLFSSPSANPVYVTEPGVQLESSFLLDVSNDPSNLGKERKVCISMFFGRSCIEVRAQRQNFGDVNEVIKLDPLEANVCDPFSMNNGELQI